MAVVPQADEAPPGLGFPVALARFAMRRPGAVIAGFLITMVISTFGAVRVREAEDLLDFIPPSDPDVIAFVGLRAPRGVSGSGEVFTADALHRINAATTAIKSVRGVDSVDSLTTVEDVVAGEGGAPDTRQLIELDRLPTSDAEVRALRERVLSRENVVGNFVSRDGSAALLLAYLADGASDRLVGHAIREAVRGAVGESSGFTAVYGGAPFAASAIYEETQSDIRRLTPLTIVILLGVILIAFRDPLGVVLTILTVAWSATVVMGVMAAVGEPFTAASATLPVILFASGTSYAVHVLGRYYLLESAAEKRGEKPSRADDAERLIAAIRIVGPPVAIASFTTAAGFLATEVMDIRPMRAFGIECGAGVLLAMVAAFLLVPAVLALYPRGRHEPAHTGRIGEQLASLAKLSQRRRRLVLGVALLLAVVGVAGVGRLKVRMEPRRFFSPGSEPWLAERFLSDSFGGSQILQIAIRGDLTEPAALHEIKRLEQFARSLPHVTQTTSLNAPLMQLNEVMGGEKRLPETRAQVPQLLFFVEGRAFMKRLLTADRSRGLVMVRTQGDSQELVASIEHYMTTQFQARPAGPNREQVAERLRWLTQAAGDPIAGDALKRILDAAKPIAPDDSRLVDMRRAIAAPLLTGADEMMPKRHLQERVKLPAMPPAPLSEIIGVFASDTRPLDRTSLLHERLIALAASPEEGEIAWSAYVDRVGAKTRELSVDDALAPAGPLPPAALPAIRDAVGDLFPSQPIARVREPMTWVLAGEPILDRGMSRSVRDNHKQGMVVAWIGVALFIGLLFRSLRLAVVSIVPAALTMVILFGGIALFGYPIDLGTSLVTSIATGAGSEFAMQYLWYLQRSTPADVVRFVGPIMVISTLLIAAGFAVLAFGHSQPMRMFGSLAALSMVGSAGLTFLLVPALLRNVDTNRPARTAAARGDSA